MFTNAMNQSNNINSKADRQPLVSSSTRKTTTPPSSTSSSSSLFSSSWMIQCLGGSIMLVVAVVFFIIQHLAKESNPVFGGGGSSRMFKGCQSFCYAQQQQRVEVFGGDILQYQDLVQLISQAKTKAMEQLHQEYGKYFADIFLEADGVSLRNLIVPANSSSSIEMFQRKLQLKILQVQLKVMDIMQEQSPNIQNQHCNCSSSITAIQPNDTQQPRQQQPPPPPQQQRRRRLNQNDSIQTETPTTTATTTTSTTTTTTQTFNALTILTPFVWATAGHSAAAGHGNLYNESYTAFMERTVKPVFASIGIDFIGRNFGMGGMKSSPEIALCAEAIFGSDPDVVSYDFGMTDGTRWPWIYKNYFFFNRVSLLPNRPALFGVRDISPHQRPIFTAMEELGIPTFLYEPSAEAKLQEGVPETLGMSTTQIQALPPFVRNFKCDGKMESGEPFCDAEKYTTFPCPNRNFKASWHPGWKHTAITGNAHALFLIDALLEAAKDLVVLESRLGVQGPRQLYDKLRALDDADHNRFVQSNLPKDLFGFYDKQFGDMETIFKDVDPIIFYRSPSMCHTALLPAQTRYLGILTESDKKGFETYDTGISKEQLESMQIKKDMEPMRLVFDSTERQNCPVALNVDYKDFFYTSSADGWTTMTVPNNAEVSAYQYNSAKQHGLIVVCLGHGSWGRHAANDLQAEQVNAGNATLEVNGKPVVSLVQFDLCNLLKGENGLKWTPDSNGKFVLKARVNIESAFLRFSSVVLI